MVTAPRSPINDPPPHLQRTSPPAVELTEALLVRRNTQHQRPIEFKPEITTSPLDRQHAPPNQLKASLTHLGSLDDRRLSPHSQLSLPGKGFLPQMTIEQRQVGRNTYGEAHPATQQLRLYIGTLNVEQMTQRTTVIILRILTYQQPQPSLLNELLELSPSPLCIRLGGLAATTDFRRIDADQAHPPTINQLQRIPIDDIPTDHRLADIRRTTTDPSQRWNGCQPGNKKGAPTERLFRIGHAH